MKKRTKRILSVLLVLILAFSLITTAMAADTEDFDYEPGENAPSEIIITYGSKTVKLSKFCTWKKWKEQDTAALAEHVAEILWQNDEDYQPVIDADDVYTFTVNEPAAFAFLKADSDAVMQGNAAEFQVVTIGYDNGTELKWKLVKDNAPVKDLLASSTAVFSGTVTVKKNAGTISIASGLSAGKYALILPDVGNTKTADEFSGATEFRIVAAADYSASDTQQSSKTQSTPTPAPSSSPTPTPTPSSGPDHSVIITDKNGNSAGVEYSHNGDLTIGTQDGSITVNTNTGDVSVADEGVSGAPWIDIGFHGDSFNIDLDFSSIGSAIKELIPKS